jgi:CPA1 family monovalent cation:H+ antiporter
LDATGDRPDSAPDGNQEEAAYRAIRRDLLTAEAAELMRLRVEGLISESARRRVQRNLDIRETGLSDTDE